MASEYSDSYGSSFDEYCIWLDGVINDMFDSLPLGDLKDMPHTDAEMAELSYGQAYAEHFSDAERPRISHYGPSRAKDRLNIGRRRRAGENGRWD